MRLSDYSRSPAQAGLSYRALAGHSASADSGQLCRRSQNQPTVYHQLIAVSDEATLSASLLLGPALALPSSLLPLFLLLLPRSPPAQLRLCAMTHLREESAQHN